ncbi:MAG: hypothetical protein K6E10_01240 [Eubacterium sp.]|nr:hypothetical protein [Eubacterium sp.]
MNKQLLKNLIFVLATIVITILSIWLPGFMMKRDAESQLLLVNDVPGEYSSEPSEVIIENASKQLTHGQCIQLISGMWESTIEPVSEDACKYNEFGIKNMLVNRLYSLYYRKLFPIAIGKESDDWYYWDATPYRAIDTTFKTYAAVFWDISMTKYDDTSKLRFIMTESGDILYASYESEESISDFRTKLDNSSYLMNYFGENVNIIFNENSQKIITVDDMSVSYKCTKADDSKLEKINQGFEADFVKGFDGFEADEAYYLYQTEGTSYDAMVTYNVITSKSDNSYELIMIPNQE